MKRQILLGLAFSVVAVNAFAHPLVAEGGAERLQGNRVAEGGAERLLERRVAEGGSDRLQERRLAEGGAERLLSSHV